MTVEFLYWQPSVEKPSEPAGHVGIKVEGTLYTFWPVVVRPDDTRGPVPSLINTDERLEYFVAGLRKLALDDLMKIKKRLPSGIQTYQIIFNHFDDVKMASGSGLPDFFNSLDPQSQVLGNQREVVIDASIELAKNA